MSVRRYSPAVRELRGLLRCRPGRFCGRHPQRPITEQRQTHILTSRTDLSADRVAIRMFSR